MPDTKRSTPAERQQRFKERERNPPDQVRVDALGQLLVEYPHDKLPWDGVPHPNEKLTSRRSQRESQ